MLLPTNGAARDLADLAYRLEDLRTVETPPSAVNWSAHSRHVIPGICTPRRT